MQRLLLFAARGIAILGIGFISLFALDVFAMEGSPAYRLQGFLIHLSPGFVLANPLGTNLLLGAPFLLAGLAFILGRKATRPTGSERGR